MTAYPPSPVPSDAHLSPGELPFTAFGQFGPGIMDNRVFDQDVYWVNIAGQPFRLEEMSEDYRRNVIAFLHEHVDYYHLQTARREVLDAVVGATNGTPTGALLSRSLGIPAVTDLDPITWLESTPLMRRLRALTPPSPTDDSSR